MKINNPFVIPRTFLNKSITITLRDLSIIKGVLIAFDEHFNICIKRDDFNATVIRGENVLFMGI